MASYELGEDLKDITNSLAYNVLENMYKDGTLSKNAVDLYKSKYGKIHQTVIGAYANEKKFLKRAKDLNHRLMSEKIRLEKTQLNMQEDSTEIANLKAQVAKTEADHEQGVDREAMLGMQISELEHEKKECDHRLEEREAAQNQAMEPQLQRAREEVALTLKEITLLGRQKDQISELCDEYGDKQRQLQETVDTNQLIMDQHEREYKKIGADPDRVRKQAEKFRQAVKGLVGNKQTIISEITDAEVAVNQISEKKDEQDKVRTKSQLRLQMVDDSVKLTQASTDEVKGRLDREKNDYTEAVTTRVGFDMNLGSIGEDLHHAFDGLSLNGKIFAKMKRDFKRKESTRDSVKQSLPIFEGQIADYEHQKNSTNIEQKRQGVLLDEIQNEVDLFIGAFLKQESLEKEKKEECQQVEHAIEDAQEELIALKKQAHQWSSHFKFISQQREALARDAVTANRLCRETQEEVQMKELAEVDVKKKLHEITLKQKEFCTAYEVVKTERNKYVTMIQSSAQHLSEMKENLKILQNEVEILRMESVGKDKALQSTRLLAQRERVRRDQLRTEYAKVSTKSQKLNEEVEQYVNEIDKLNSIINAIEKEMVIMRRKYEQAIESRNFTGIQLIDRNDELCILWEKSNLQEKVLQRGEAGHREKEEYLRILRLDLSEVKRQLVVVQKNIPEVPRLAAKELKLKEQLKQVKEESEALAMELETGQTGQKQRQWRHLGGHDPDLETLLAKVQFLEQRLNEKMEKLLEKELIVEEVTALTDKLRKQAIDGREGTLDLSQKVNVFQARIKVVTRKMMALVSELSMYQATAMKLEHERDDICSAVLRARKNAADGLPPTEDSPQEYERHRMVQAHGAEDQRATIQRKLEDEVLNSNATRTTAEPRVNAYVPEGDIGLPKAYGASAPFMPCTLGTTMRHTRKPNPRPIEI
eukprot:GEMP01009168.1.p1 GENE.GEMP01009168.1~~GEMP01009168.1.p1  ORF type:complete len:930 (+),score=259.91 GEMP01009168.1:182-2971(+)